jgi:hypothetical protein
VLMTGSSISRTPSAFLVSNATSVAAKVAATWGSDSDQIRFPSLRE